MEYNVIEELKLCAVLLRRVVAFDESGGGKGGDGSHQADSIELDDEAIPDNSHVSRSDVKINGIAQKIYRRSVPYGGVLEHGLYFLAFSADIRRFDHILQNMFGVSGDGVHDHLKEFSSPVSGSYWFAPSAAELFAISSL